MNKKNECLKMQIWQWLRYRCKKQLYQRRTKSSEARVKAYNELVTDTHQYQSDSDKTVYVDNWDLRWFFTSNLSATRDFKLVKNPEEAEYIFFITIIRDFQRIKNKKVFFLFQEPKDYSSLYFHAIPDSFFLENQVTVISHFENADLFLNNKNYKYIRAFAGYHNFHGATLEILNKLDEAERPWEIFSITSGLRGIPGNLKRKIFIEMLAAKNSNFDYYGRFNKESFSLKNYKGLCDLKFELLGSYKYNLVIENSPQEDWYISEKIFDALICGCFPIYHGTKKIFDILPNEWFYYLPSLELAEIEKLNLFLKTDAYKAVANNRHQIASFIDKKFGFYSVVEDLVNNRPLQCSINSMSDGDGYVT